MRNSHGIERLMVGLTVLVALCSSLVANGQTHYESNIAIGGKSGITLSKLNFNPSVPQTMLLGAMAGVTFRYMEECHFGIIAELNVEQRGWKEKFEGSALRYSRRFTYLQLPVLTHIYFGNSKFHGFFNLGPEIAFMISQSTSSNFDYQNWETVADEFVIGRNTDQFTIPVEYKFDYGITAGAGMELIMGGKHSVVLEGRFYYGLHDVFSHDAAASFSASSGMSILVTLGYYFRIK